MGLTPTINKIKKIKYISLSILVVFILFCSFLFIKGFYGRINPVYFPNQSKSQIFSNPKNLSFYLVANKKYKDIEIKVIDSKGGEIKEKWEEFNNPKIQGEDSPKGYMYYYNSSDLKHIKVIIKNKSKKIQIIGYGIWTRIEDWSNQLIK